MLLTTEFGGRLQRTLQRAHIHNCTKWSVNKWSWPNSGTNMMNGIWVFRQKYIRTYSLVYVEVSHQLHGSTFWTHRELFSRTAYSNVTNNDIERIAQHIDLCFRMYCTVDRLESKDVQEEHEDLIVTLLNAGVLPVILSWMRRQYVPPNRWLTFSGLHVAVY